MVDSGKDVQAALPRYSLLSGCTFSILKKNAPFAVDYHPIFPHSLMFPHTAVISSQIIGISHTLEVNQKTTVVFHTHRLSTAHLFLIKTA